MRLKNRFGEGEIYTIDELLAIENMSGRPIAYCTSAACMSVTTDMQSWVSDPANRNRLNFVSKNRESSNKIIIILGCQVTDLAILNDIRLAEKLRAENPTAQIYMGGCLAYRFDIELPRFVKRLAATRSVNTEINTSKAQYINWERPFWVDNDTWENKTSDLDAGRLFRTMYPIKIGAGCSGNCKYCTIRDTRGGGYEVDAYLQVAEFLAHDNIVLISDSPTEQQIKDWCYLAKRYNKSISVRNIEPNVAVKCRDELLDIAKLGLLKIFHCPVQSNNAELLSYMGRDSKSTFDAIKLMQQLRKDGVKIATNIIIDYKVSTNDGDINYSNFDKEWLDNNFDYWSINPYFDGKFNREKAEDRFERYINGDNST